MQILNRAQMHLNRYFGQSYLEPYCAAGPYIATVQIDWYKNKCFTIFACKNAVIFQ